MKFSYNWIKEYVDTALSAKEAAERLTMHSFEVEEVLEDGEDAVLDIDILPNRMPDASSHVGVARELAVLTKNTLTPPEPTIEEDEETPVQDQATIQVRDTALCPRYSARVIHDVRVGESPLWLQRRLRAVGLKPINNIVDAANYVMLELGQPLHAFDLDTLSQKRIVVRQASQGEEILTLDDETFALTSNDLVIADADRPVAIAGIKGGKETGVTQGTTRVLLEAANFAPAGIRRTAQRLKLHTDASARFSAGLSPELTIPALQRLTKLIVSLAGGRVAAGVLDAYPEPQQERTVRFSLSRLHTLLGSKEVSADDVKDILTRLGFGVTAEDDDTFLVVVPALRTDVTAAEDVLEEVARIVGYENIQPQPLYAHLGKVVPHEDRRFRDTLRSLLAAQGFNEIRSYAFVDEAAQVLEETGAEGVPREGARWELRNPLSSIYQYLRRSLVPGLLRAVQENQRFAEDLQLFEIGKVYWKDAAGTPHEEYALALARAEAAPAAAHDAFYTLKGSVERLFEDNGIFGVWFDDDEKAPNMLNPAKSAVIYTEDNTRIGRLGELHPRVQKDSVHVEGRVVLALFSLPVLQEHALADRFYQEVPAYPPLKRDIAFIVSSETRIADIENVIYTAGGEYLADVDLFDIYEDVAKDSIKSVAFHLVFQSAEKTLTIQDVESDEKAIKKALQEKLNAEIR